MPPKPFHQVPIAERMDMAHEQLFASHQGAPVRHASRTPYLAPYPITMHPLNEYQFGQLGHVIYYNMAGPHGTLSPPNPNGQPDSPGYFVPVEHINVKNPLLLAQFPDAPDAPMRTVQQSQPVASQGTVYYATLDGINYKVNSGDMANSRLGLIDSRPTQDFIDPAHMSKAGTFTSGYRNESTQLEVTPAKPVPAPVLKLYFANHEAALAGRTEWDWEPHADESIPTDDAERGEWVLKLVNAMKDVSQIHDKQSMVLKHRWVIPETEGRPAQWKEFYDSQQLEMVCWDLVHMVEHFHQRGPTFLHIYDSATLKIAKRSRNLTFEARMNIIIQLLAISKGRCDLVMKGEDIEALVAAPRNMLLGVTSNIKQNIKRHELIIEGRKFINRKTKNELKAESEAEGNDTIDGAGTVALTTPDKHPRKHMLDIEFSNESNEHTSKRVRNSSNVFTSE